MNELNLTIKPGEQPPTRDYIESRHRALTSRWRVAKYITNGSACFALAGLAALTLGHVQDGPAHAVAQMAYGFGLVGALLGRQFVRTAQERCAEVSLAGEGLLGEASALASASETAREYMANVRAQGRRLTLAEVKALRDLAARTPVEVSQAALYG